MCRQSNSEKNIFWPKILHAWPIEFSGILGLDNKANMVQVNFYPNLLQTLARTVQTRQFSKSYILCAKICHVWLIKFSSIWWIDIDANNVHERFHSKMPLARNAQASQKFKDERDINMHPLRQHIKTRVLIVDILPTMYQKRVTLRCPAVSCLVPRGTYVFL